MTVIRRQECQRCGSAETINRAMDGDFCGHHPDAGTVWVEYVSAGQLAGAVSLLGEAATGLRTAADLVAGGNVERELRALAVKLDTFGGQ